MSIETTLRKAAKLAKDGNRAGAAALYREVLARFPGNATAKKGLAALSAPAPRPGPMPGGALGAGLIPGARPVAPPPGLKGAATPSKKARARPAARQQGKAPIGPAPSAGQMQALARLMARGDHRAVLAEGQRLALLFPRAPALLNLLGLAQARAGRHDDAIATFDRLTAIDPAFAGAFVNKASSLSRLGRHDEAIPAARAALKLDPGLVQAHMLLGYALVNSGAPEDAIVSFGEAVRLAPKLAAAHIGLGNAFASCDQNAEALAAFEAARDLDPDSADVFNNIGNTLNALGRSDEAIAALSRAIELGPNRPSVHLNLARVLLDIGEAVRAIEEARAEISLVPKSAGAWKLLGSALITIGDQTGAADALDHAIALDPHDYMSIAKRWRFAPLPLDHPEYARIAALAASRGDGSKGVHALSFALFKAHDKAGDPEGAFAHLERANRLRREAEPYHIEDQKRVFAAIRAQFTPPPAPLSDDDIAEVPAPHRPVLIVGMPRSGTTLVEQILASHSQVHGGGELPSLGLALRELGWTEDEVGAGPDRDTLLAVRRGYFEGIARLGAPRPVITDKTPLNFRYLGHALAAMPEARVLVMERDPRATCWSNFSNSFQGRANNFGNDMLDTAEMYLMQRDLVAFWQKLYPDRVTMVPYERLTEHQEDESRKLVAAAGLDWEDACLDFHKTDRAVRTVSSSQVRKKMYTGSSEAWRRYEAYLGPMLDRLAAGGAEI